MVLENYHFLNASEEVNTAVVVGADSSIGRALIPELLLKYKSLILTETSENYDELKQRVKKLKGSHPTQRVVSFELDIRNKNSIEHFGKCIEDKYRI